jgi:hypothetical protein
MGRVKVSANAPCHTPNLFYLKHNRINHHSTNKGYQIKKQFFKNNGNFINPNWAIATKKTTL